MSDQLMPAVIDVIWTYDRERAFNDPDDRYGALVVEWCRQEHLPVEELSIEPPPVIFRRADGRLRIRARRKHRVDGYDVLCEHHPEDEVHVAGYMVDLPVRTWPEWLS